MKTKNLIQGATFLLLALSLSLPAFSAEMDFHKVVIEDTKAGHLEGPVQNHWTRVTPGERNLLDRHAELLGRVGYRDEPLKMTEAEQKQYQKLLAEEKAEIKKAALMIQEESLSVAKENVEIGDKAILEKHAQIERLEHELGEKYKANAPKAEIDEALLMVRRAYNNLQDIEEEVKLRKDTLARINTSENLEKIMAYLYSGKMVPGHPQKFAPAYLKGVAAVAKRINLYRAAATAAGVAVGWETVAAEKQSPGVLSERYPDLKKLNSHANDLIKRQRQEKAAQEAETTMDADTGSVSAN